MATSEPIAAPPPPWNVPPAPAWSVPAAAAPASIDQGLAPEAASAAPAMPAPPAEPPPPPWRASAPGSVDVAATMVAPPPADDREPTTLMPAWQPPPAVPVATTPPPAVPETMATPTRPPAPAVGGPQAELTIESGPDAGHMHRASDHALRLGRSPDNDVILRDPATSGHHARLERRGDEFWLVDLGSTNGTFVNGESIQEKELNQGDRVTIGQNSVHFGVVGA